MNTFLAYVSNTPYELNEKTVEEWMRKQAQEDDVEEAINEVKMYLRIVPNQIINLIADAFYDLGYDKQIVYK